VLGLLTGIILWAFSIAIPQFLFLFPQSICAGIQIGLSDVNMMPIQTSSEGTGRIFLSVCGGTLTSVICLPQQKRCHLKHKVPHLLLKQNHSHYNSTRSLHWIRTTDGAVLCIQVLHLAPALCWVLIPKAALFSVLIPALPFLIFE
jgi:hypothetical protein